MPNKQPTNADILSELKDLGKRVLVVEDWKRSEEAYRAALAQVKAEEKAAKSEAGNDEYMKRRTEIMKQIGIILGLVVLILSAYAATKGIST